MAQAKAKALMRALFILCLLLTTGAIALAQEWHNLEEEHKRVLAPLEGNWAAMHPERKSVWVGIAKLHNKLDQTAQGRLRERMQHWESLSKEERAHVIERYIQHKHRSPQDQRELEQQWQEYQRLPEEEKARYRAM